MTRLRGARELVARRRQQRRDARRLEEIGSSRAAPRDTVRVYYGVDAMPSRSTVASGGFLKFQRLSEAFPNAPRDFNVLYLGSSSMPPDTTQLIELARARGAVVVWNQNGVAYPAWHGPGWEQLNELLAAPLHAADHAFYQSEFCRLSADRYLGARSSGAEVLYNAVDTRVFTPAGSSHGGGVTLLMAGSHRHRYRLAAGLETAAELQRSGTDVRLLVAGPLRWTPDPTESVRDAVQLAARLDVADRVEFLGPYTQADAPELFRRADILLHTQYNDACPALVLEAMACGLAIVYSASGGVPELVGADAGVGVPAPLDWEDEHPPAPAELAAAVARVAERLDDHRAAARDRAVARFDLEPWIRRHADVFARLLA